MSDDTCQCGCHDGPRPMPVDNEMYQDLMGRREWLIEDVAAYFLVSVNTVYAWNKNKTGPRFVRLRVCHYSRDDCLAWWEQKKDETFDSDHKRGVVSRLRSSEQEAQKRPQRRDTWST